MALFAALLVLICDLYLFPAMAAYAHADAKQRQILSLHALLLLCATLVILGLFLVLLVRLGRSMFRPPDVRPKPTVYVDAWKEAGKRLQPPEE